jgi:LysM repeat protein
MAIRTPQPRLTAAFALLGFAACGSIDPPPPVPAPDPLVVENPAPEPETDSQREPERPLQERWLSPFAVSSAGRIIPLEPRRVSVIHSDPSMASVATGGDGDAPAPTPPAEGASRPPTPTAAAPGGIAGSGAARTPPRAAPADPSGEAEAEAARPVRTEPEASPEQEPTPRPEAAAPPAPAGPTGSHLVQRGETWSGIARRYRVSTRALAEANPTVEAERIRVGQTLRIPAASPAAPARTHVVSSGDTLWGIARRYGVAAEEIRQLNRLPDDRVRLGQTLLIP